MHWSHLPRSLLGRLVLLPGAVVVAGNALVFRAIDDGAMMALVAGTTLAAVLGLLNATDGVRRGLFELEIAALRLARGDLGTSVTPLGPCEVRRIGRALELARIEANRRTEAHRAREQDLREDLAQARATARHLGAERRAAFAEAGPRLQASIVGRRGIEHLEVLDYLHPICVVRGDASLRVIPGSLLSLHVAHRGLSHTVEVTALHHRSTSDGVELTLLLGRFDPPAALPEWVRGRLIPSHAPRVQPTQPLVARIEGGGRSYLCQATRLSTSGAALVVPVPTAQLSDWQCEITLHIEVHDHALTLPAEVLRIEPHANNALAEIHFVRGPQLDASLDALAGYVTEQTRLQRKRAAS